jgi:hypothetical protein
MNKSLRTIVLIIQICGGLVGLGLIGRSILTEQTTQSTAIGHVVFILVFTFGIVAGLALIMRPKLGLWLSAVFQAMQIPILIGPTAAYALFSGACFNLYRHATGFGFNFLFGSRYYFAVQSGEPWMVGINALALVLFILLIREIWFVSHSFKICESKSNMEYPPQQLEHEQIIKITEVPCDIFYIETSVGPAYPVF